ncbi:MAG TPA: hypothetical protein VLW55_20005 [Burkholderiaceae bacterium]|nr:hypothetical protein [Burkholderiaceae bacterium]
MNQRARKPGEGKHAESLPVDDPSIPVLTERLTLPPLDLNLDFRLPERPATPEENTVAPVADVPIAPLQPIEPVEPRAPLEAEESAAAEAPPQEEPAEDSERTVSALATHATVEPQEPVEPPEATDTSPRVPTSLLMSNIGTLPIIPPGATLYREVDEFDLAQSGGTRPNRMTTDLREMILLELARRLPTEVETIVRRHLEGAIEEAIRRFAAEVRIALAGSLREIVDRAVKAELDRLNVPRK